MRKTRKAAPSVTRSIPIAVETVERRIHYIQGQKVMLDTDLAELYHVQTFNLNKAVKRNKERFPQDFMFQLTSEELSLTFQNGMSKTVSGRGGRRTPPYVFTEQGVAMLSTVLRSKQAIQVNITIMRAFVKIRDFLAQNKEIARKLEALEKKYVKHDRQLDAVFQAIRELMTPAPEPPKRRIGFAIDVGKDVGQKRARAAG